MAHHSSVNYVEPNASAIGVDNVNSNGNINSWKVLDYYNRSPRLEDYCIVLNIEAEVCSRDNIVNSTKKESDVIIMRYETNGKKETVSFLSGTKVQTHNAENHSVNYLTTNYADMYVGDLVDYGTTEMIGVKSVDIEYQKSCVPILNIVFTDVRGLSLFQPTELSRTNQYNGIKGLNIDNIAQSFFQCFFRVPMPKFTITLKGFYGKPVTYEVMCDKFDTKFNSSTGDFDINTRFVGYSYSFLTDVSMDALIAAPYSDYIGKQYWEDNVKNGRFTLFNREKTEKKRMPTLVEAMNDIDVVLAKTFSDLDSGLTNEEKNHSEQINMLTNIRTKYQNWYATLYNVVCERYGKDYCFILKESNDTDSDYKGIIILKQMSTDTRIGDLENDYKTYPSEFKKINNDLKITIDEYQSKGFNFNNIENVSEDFSDYRLSPLFNKLFVNSQNKLIFNGFNIKNEFPESEFVNGIFYGVSYTKNEEGKKLTNEEIQAKKEQHRNYVLEKIYNDGVNQYIYCYYIAPNYRMIKNIINTLQDDAKMSVEDREEKKKNTLLNNKIYGEMMWYPTVENFTKIMLAHLETLMNIMYTTINNMSGRTASALGVTVGEDGVLNDVNPDAEIPPFPRVSRNIIGSDEIVKKEDTWVGEYQNLGTRKFEEIEIINGLLNGIDSVKNLVAENNEVIKDITAPPVEEEHSIGVIQYPLSTFDFIINKSPYGDSNEISNDIEGYDFAGKVALRMFVLMTLNRFSITFSENWNAYVDKIAETEALNFKKLVKIGNSNFLSRLRNDEINSDFILSAITNSNTSENCPWGKDVLFKVGVHSSKGLWPVGYELNEKNNEGASINWAFPIQNVSFKEKNEFLDIINQNKNTTFNGDYAFAKSCGGYTNLKDSDDNTGLGTIFISDNVNYGKEVLDKVGDSSEQCYNGLFRDISSRVEFDSNKSSFIDSLFKASSVIERQSIFKRLGNDASPIKTSNYTFDENQNFLVLANNGGIDSTVSYESSYNELYGLSNESVNGSITSFTITECFTNVISSSSNGTSIMDFNSSFLYKNFCYGNRIPDSFNYASYTFKVKELAILMGFAVDLSYYKKYFNLNGLSCDEFGYVPKIAILQLGVDILMYNLVNGYIFEKNDSKIKLISTFIPPNSNASIVLSYNFTARLNIVKYLYNWLERNRYLLNKFILSKGLDDVLINGKPKSSLKNKTDEEIISELEKTPYAIPNDIFTEKVKQQRFLLNENSDTIKTLSNELLSSCFIDHLSLYTTTQNGHAYTYYKYNALTIDNAKAYLNSFIGKLKVLYGINSEVKDKNGAIVKLSKEPTNATEDIKKELYRYLKQLYDKWIPMNNFDDWKIESFFKDEEGTGHNFYFIDSFYNYIGDKLLINPKTLGEKIKAFLAYKDVNAMMLGFMADIYAVNRCMLMSIQNFFDLKKPGSMNDMFSTKSFNEIEWGKLNKTPSFVVVYPYEPSKNLDIPNNEYVNDGFMLNDENETPIAIKTKTNKDGQYMIPAFGVSYGRQYQSYFKSINIDMQSPVATQQSIKAKHYILQESVGTTPANKTVSSQDLFDIYSTQSYTCEVEMMGCAWIQPLMYFVLLNVPMFRGSYMIMKVKHSLSPGNMTTRFTGCRMANVSTKFVENIFSDEKTDESTSNNNTNRGDVNREQLASIENDCPYKVFPLYSVDGSGPDFSSELDRLVQPEDCNRSGLHGVDAYSKLQGKTVLDSICGIAINEGGYSTLNQMLTTCVVYNRYNVAKSFKKTIFVHGQFDIVKAREKIDQGIPVKVKEFVRGIFTQSPSYILSHFNKTVMTHTNKNRMTSHTDSKFFKKGDEIVEKSFGVEELTYLYGFGTIEEFQHKLSNPWVSDKAPVIMAQDALDSGPNLGKYISIFVGTYKNIDKKTGKPINDEAKAYWTPAEPTKKTEKESINTAFFNAIQKSCSSTPSINVTLEKEELGGETNQMRIKGSEKIENVFDMIVTSSEYIKYVKKIYWERGNVNGENYSVKPESIVVELHEEVQPEHRQIFITSKHNGSQDGYSEELPQNTNINFLKTLAKRRAALGSDSLILKEVPQLKDAKLLDGFMPQNCESVVSSVMPTQSNFNVTGDISGVNVHGGRKVAKRNSKIEYIVIHYTAGASSKPGSAKSTCSYFDNSDRKASADFVVDDAEICQYNSDIEKQYTYHCGNGKKQTPGGTLFKICKCQNSIGIEVCSTFNGRITKSTKPNDAGWSYTDATLTNALNLTKSLMNKYNIDIEHVVRHYDVCGKLCPGIIGYNAPSGSEEKWNAFKNALVTMTPPPSQTIGTNTDWATSVKRMAEWFLANVHNYSNSQTTFCDLTNDKVRHDCSGFVSACLRLFGVKNLYSSSEGFHSNQGIANMLTSKGFQKMEYSYETVKPFDIIVAYKNKPVGKGKYHHVEIFAQKGNPNKSYGWGSAKSALPANTGGPNVTDYATPQNGAYDYIWRYVG